MTWIDERRHTIAAVKKEVLKVLSWKEEQYNDFVIDTGIAYLREMCQNDAHVQFFIGSRVFWNWWRNYWSNRDAGFLDTWMPFDDAEELYRETHDAKTLAKALYPNGIILAKTFSPLLRTAQI